MKSFLSNNASLIQMTALVVMIISYILLFIFRIYNKTQARKINNLFILKSKIPLRLTDDYLNQSIFFLSYVRVMLPFCKMILSTEYGSKRKTSEYIFFKELPTKLTIGFKFEVLMWVIGLTSFITLIISGGAI
ncbi:MULTISPECIES: hypothetical protein [Citrobacter]|uniref:Uncharacterized protein n=1 Tax=Citrobacter pasteurii TaxID=1563222 RepID=A0ABX8K5J6_9ENTR|nr:MULTISPECIES: hypothetical protein [Citrobacter]QXA43246.1 hypothetical protein I6L54_14745 [Citrobacter pasteurii]TKU56504.1 hypothetical protein FDX05_16055 [Citrobacter sp. wls715]